MLNKILLIITTISKTVSCISCKDESGLNVPTWTIMKLPQGTDYYYYDITNGYTMSQNSLNDTNIGALSNTLKQLWDANINYIIYNDEPPNQVEYNFSVAHSKAVWIWDDSNAIVITHSIPKFPQGPGLEEEYTGLMENAWDYGQAASCFQVSLSALPQVLNLIYETVPLIYDESCQNCYETVLNINENSTNSCPTYIIDGQHIMFMKPSTNNVDIWASCIAPYFSSNVSVESWIHGTMDKAYCPPSYAFQTLDIQSLKFPEGQTFAEYNDHSKWGILESPLVCFGDLNRVTSQMVRSGTVYCWKDYTLWTELNQLIVSTNTC
jgi:hypothetical protein